jgi:radical SAM superfamily enzyme YgiQ (UPF0313 family)
MTDILLIQPPIRDYYLTAKRTVPYGLASIAATLAPRGFSVEILDALATAKSRPVEPPPDVSGLEKFYGKPDVSPFALFHRFRHFGWSFEHIGRQARDSGAWLVGVSSLFTAYADEALAAAEAVKRSLPRSTVVLGGHHPTALPESVLASPWVDFVLRGEGEASMPLLAQNLREGRDVGSVPGIGFRRPDGSLSIDAPAHLPRLEGLPRPAFELLNHRHYRRGGRASAVVVASRGCPLRCSYCSVGAAAWLPHRLRPVPEVLAEIAWTVARHGAGFIDFEDENLSLNRDWFLEILEGLAPRGGGPELELRAMNGLFPPTLDAQVVSAMCRAGFRNLNLSLGSTHPRQLRRFRRADIRTAFDRALALAEDVGLTAVGYIIVGAPYQRAEDSVDDLLFLSERRVLAGVSVFYPAPGSPDFDGCRKLGLLPGRFGCLRASALPIDHTTRREDSATLLRLGRVLNFMKHLLDIRQTLPTPSHAGMAAMDPTNRIEVGRGLLAAFLADGRIRGLTPAGEIYDHQVSTELTARFRRGLQTRSLRGTI